MMLQQAHQRKCRSPITITLSKAQDFKTSGEHHYFSVSPDNEKLGFISRGGLFPM
jgi:hypothetical protein